MINWFIPAIASAFLTVFSTITEKKILYNISALNFSVMLSFVNLVLSVPFFFAINYNTLSDISLLILFGKSVLGVLAFLCVMTALKELQISHALPLLALTPGFVAVFAFLFLGEGLKFYEVIGLILLLIGIHIIETSDLASFVFSFKAFIKPGSHKYILAALLLFTVSSILDKLLLKKYNLSPAAVTAFQHLFFAIIFYLIFLVRSREKLIYTVKAHSDQLWWIVLVSVLTIGYRYTQLWAVSMAPVALVLAIKRTSVFWASLIGGKIFKDTDLLRKVLAAAVIVAGTILILRD